ncbi:DUF6303 family protein [Streptomyces globosus]|uniref:DUF6303 family protein n=1 Tax=Streptomyces globosus TaxID=68209 RepID=UPI0031CF2AE3
MEIKHDGTPYYAALVCSGTFGEPAAWTLHIVDEDGVMSEALFQWPCCSVPVPLLDRYDALAVIGFAPVTGGVEAWSWNECSREGAGSYFIATARVRPLRADELSAATGPTLKRLGM